MASSSPEAEVVRLSMEDQRKIADAIIEAPAPNSALRRSFKRRRRLLGRVNGSAKKAER